MALGFYFAPTALTAEKYHEIIQRLAKAGAGHPAGRTYHSAFGAPEKVMVFEVWTSQAAFDTFGQTLMPILQERGVDPGQPSVMEIHNEIRPPAKAAAARKPAKAKVKTKSKGKAKPAASRRRAKSARRR